MKRRDLPNKRKRDAKERYERRQRKKRRNNEMRGSFRLRQAMKIVLFARSKKCAYCGTHLTFQNATLDHIIPLGRGGSAGIENVTLACADCNRKKGHSLDWKPDGTFTGTADMGEGPDSSG